MKSSWFAFFTFVAIFVLFITIAGAVASAFDPISLLVKFVYSDASPVAAAAEQVVPETALAVPVSSEAQPYVQMEALPLPTLAPISEKVPTALPTLPPTLPPIELPTAEPTLAPTAAPAVIEVVDNAVANAAAAVVANPAVAAAAVEVVNGAAEAAPVAVPQLGTVNGETLEQFASRNVNGQIGQVTGVFVPDQFALPVIQQPWNQANFVSTEANNVTQFALPAKHGVTALLAHNYLSGSLFFNLMPGQVVAVVYGDGATELYQISHSVSYQALTPTSPYSNFVDVSDPSETEISSADLFQRVYTTPGQLVFQTCIKAYGDPSWGRLFVTAEKLN